MQTPAFVATKTVRTSKLFRGLIWVVAGMAACLCPALALGQTNSSWNGGVGNWSNATDWSPNTVPNNGGGNTYNVTIDSGGSDEVTLNQDASISSLVVGGDVGLSSLKNLSGTAEVLDVTGAVTVNSRGSVNFGDGSTLTVGGTFTNNGQLTLGYFDADDNVANLGTLVNNGYLYIGSGSTLNLTNQPSGITDIAPGSTIVLLGKINAGTNNGLANLSSIEGALGLANGQSFTPSANTLTVGIVGMLDIGRGSSLTITNLSNSGTVVTGNKDDFTTGSLTVLGSFVNASTGTLDVGYAGIDAASIGELNNSGIVNIGGQSTLAVTGLGTMTASAKININTGGELIIESSSVTLSGGSLTLNGGIVTGGAGSDVLINDSAKIQGYGTIGNNSMGLINDTLISAIGKGTVLTIDPSAAGFNNRGALTVGPGATLDITGPSNSFLNFDTATGMLSGGSYTISNGTLKFDNANIVTNAANITLYGSQSAIVNQSGGDALTNLATNASAGSFMLEGGRNFTTSAAFTNSGKVTISKDCTFSVGETNSYTQAAGTTTVYGSLSSSGVTVSGGSLLDVGTTTTGNYIQKMGKTNVSGTLTVVSPGGVNVSGGSIFDSGTITSNSYKQTGGTTTVNGTLTAASGGVNISGGSVFGVGTITGNIDLTGGLLSAGSASKKAGELTLKGTYTQSAAGAFDVDLGGTTAGTQYDVLNISGTASLGGVLNVDLISGFKPTVGETFNILNYTSETGTFTMLNLPKLTGGDTWSISYNATGVVLTVDGPAAVKGVVSASPAKRVTRGMITGSSADVMREPVAILSRATCFGARMLMASAACGSEALAGVASGEEKLATATAGSGAIHNNIMVATRAMSGGRGGAGRESSASVTAMTRLYVCAYLPSTITRTMGCN